jgi:hypothetical protein
METSEVTASASVPQLVQRGKLAQIGRGLLCVALLAQTLFALGLGAVGLWTGFAAIGNRPAFPGNWPWYLNVAGGAFLVLGGAASLVALATLVQDRRVGSPHGIRWLGLWAAIVFTLLLPIGMLLFALAASPAFNSGQHLIPSWLFWQLVFGLVAFGVWTLGRRAGFGKPAVRAATISGLVGSVLLAAVVVGSHTASRALVESLKANPFGPCAFGSGSCWQRVDAATAQLAADHLHGPVAWVSDSGDIQPESIHASTKLAVEDMQLNGSPVALVSYPDHVPLCLSSACSTARFVKMDHMRVWIYTHPDGGLEMAWARSGRSYRLLLFQSNYTRVPESRGASVFGMIRYALPISSRPSNPPSVHPSPNESPTVADTVPPAVDQAASNLYDSWKSGDEVRARTLANGSAVRRLFATTWQPKYLPVTCRPSKTAGYDCASLHPGAYLYFLVGLRIGSHSRYWVMKAVACNTDPCYTLG